MRSLTDVPSKDSGSLTRADLADAVRRRVGLSRAESADHVDAVLAEIFEVIVSGESLSSILWLLPCAIEERTRCAQSKDRKPCHGLRAARREIQTLWDFPRAHQRTFINECEGR